MRNLLIVFLIICIIFLIIFFPFKTRVMGHVNLLEMKCYYSVKSWIIKLLCGKIIVDNGKIKMTNDDTILTGDVDKLFVKKMVGEIMSKLDIKKIEIFFTGGFKENSFSSAIICGSILSIVETLYGNLSLSFDNIKMYKDIKPTFDEDNLELTIDIVVSMSLIKILNCFLKVGKKTKKLKEINNEG